MNARLEQFKNMDEARLAKVEAGKGKGVCKFVMAGANGYSCRYSDGSWGYIVTKSPYEATRDVVINGWIGSMGGVRQ